jgi:H+/gluconate symporter-like permease
MHRRRSPLILLLLLVVWGWALSATWSQQDDGQADVSVPATDADDAASDAQPAADAAVDTSSSESTGGDDGASSTTSAAADDTFQKVYWPLITLGVGIAIVLGLIIFLKVNAFIALITAAIAVSLMAEGDWSGKISRVADAFGSAAGNIGIVIALAAVIGKCMLDSGAADRVVRAFLRLLGEKRAPVALMGSGFILAVPVFFDTVFYLLVPLARSMYRRTGKNYLLYIMAISAGGAVTHTLVPPTPGPLVMADNLNFDVGMMIMIGALVALPAAIVGLVVAVFTDRIMPIPMRKIGSEPDPKPLSDSELPSLLMSLAPVLLPVLLISTNTVLTTLADGEHAALLKPSDVTNWAQLQTTLREQAAAEGENPAKRISATLDGGSGANRDERDEVAALLTQESPLSTAEQQTLIDGLNQFVLPEKGFHRGETETAFLGILPNDAARSLLKKDRGRLKKTEAERLNRALLESAYPDLIKPHVWDTQLRQAADYSSLFGNANLALLLSTVIAMWTLVRQRGLARIELAQAVEESLMSGGVIILITAGGGAFGAMLTQAHVGDAIKSLFQIEPGAGAGLMFLVLGFAIATVLKIAQGSSTVAMITGSAMLAGIASAEVLGFHPVYLATAIGGGSLVGSWMNDSGFWIFAKMGGLTEVEALKSWTIMLVVLGCVAFAVTLLLAVVMPMA